MARTEIPAVDLDIKASVRTVDGEKVLQYALSSPSGVVPLTHQVAQTEPFKGSLDGFRGRLIERIQKFDDRLDPYGSCLLVEDFEPELRKLGNELYRQLFPAQMKWMYRQWREKVRTIRISSDEWWIPWELIRPFDHDFDPVIDDDFLGARFQVTRWLVGGTAPAATIRVEKLACVEPGDGEGPQLPRAVQERSLLASLAQRRGIEDESPSQATLPELMELLMRGGLDLLHFVGHGEFSPDNPEDSRIILTDGRSLAAGDLVGPLLTRIAKDQPLVYLNACSVAQQGASLTSLSGWPDAWVGRGKAGAFVAPQWEVHDSLAFEFARIFYLALERGRTLGRAARLARLWTRRKNRQSATWLAFVVYGHPNARVSFGDEKALPETGLSTQPTAEPSLELRPPEAGTISTEENMISRTHIMRDNQLDEARKLHEQEPDLKGRWIGKWENLVYPDKKGEEMIEVERQENGAIFGYFYDTSTHDITIRFEGTLRFGHLLARYWAPKGQRIMQDGYCFLKLQDDGSWRGYYADFFGCGLYVLMPNPRR